MTWHRKLLDANPEAGYKQWYYWNPDDGEIALKSEWDYEKILEDAKGLYAMVDERAPWKGTFHHVGFIPYAVIEHVRVKTGKNLLADREYAKWFLDQSENKYWRTRPGRLGG